MSIQEKMKNAKAVTCFTDLYTDEEWETRKTLSLIASEIEYSRVEMGMSQKEFAGFMGVSQGMVSRWESGTYNFTIETLTNIACKLSRTVQSFFPARKKSEYEEYAKAKAPCFVPSIHNRFDAYSAPDYTKVEELAEKLVRKTSANFILTPSEETYA